MTRPTARHPDPIAVAAPVRSRRLRNRTHRRMVFAAAGLSLASVAACRPAAAQEPTRVAVVFRLVDPDTRLVYGDRVGPFESEAADTIAARLGNQLRYLRFAAGDSTVAHRLTISLDRKDRSASAGLQELGLWARLERTGVVAHEMYWLPLLPADLSFMGLGQPDELLRRITDEFEHAGLTRLRSELLRKVPITDRAEPVLQPLGWRLPFTEHELCMDLRTDLEVANDLILGGTPFDRVYAARVTSRPRLFGEPLANPPLTQAQRQELEEAIRAQSLRVKGVYVLDYKRMGICEDPARPGRGGTGGDS